MGRAHLQVWNLRATVEFHGGDHALQTWDTDSCTMLPVLSAPNSNRIPATNMNLSNPAAWRNSGAVHGSAYGVLRIVATTRHASKAGARYTRLGLTARRDGKRIHPERGNNRDVSAERCWYAASVSGTPESYSRSGPREDARTPAGTSIAFPRSWETIGGART